MKKWIASFYLLGAFSLSSLAAHCQMPCGIYHDAMVYDQIDQFVETMVKGMTVIKDNKFSTPQERNELVRWVNSKEEACDEVAHILTFYFLQQKIKPGEETSTEQLESVHRLLFYLVTIKQTADLKAVSNFDSEWEKFKLFFHVQGYQCAVEKKSLKEWEDKRTAAEKAQQQKEQESMIKHAHDEQGEHTHEDGTTHSH